MEDLEIDGKHQKRKVSEHRPSYTAAVRHTLNTVGTHTHTHNVYLGAKKRKFKRRK